MIDIHTHLYFPQYDDDRDETIQRAFAGGMTRMVSVGTEPGDWEQALAITAHDDRIKAAVGLHPHWFDEQKAEDGKQRTESDGRMVADVVQSLRSFIVTHGEKIVAIGECGLDYFTRDENVVSGEEKMRQKELFLAQIQLAQEFSLPLIVHTRPSAGSMDAYEDVSDLLQANEAQKLQIILHCYMGNTEVTKHFLELPNVYFSFTGNITYPTKKSLIGTKDDLTETVKMIPLERILTETDCPFLAPQQYRGGRNEPSYVTEVVEKIAKLKGVSVDHVNEWVATSADRVLGKLS